MKTKIREASPSDAGALTEIAFAAKKYWDYPPEYFDIWKDELTVTESYVINNTVFIAESDGHKMGFYSIVHVAEDFFSGKIRIEKGWWLEHIFIRPEYIGKGVGTQLMEHACRICGNKGVAELKIMSDPHAKGFYEKLGARYCGEMPSSIEGRTVSLFNIQTKSL